MPTGYTAMIDDDPKMSTRRWIVERLSRAFSFSINLRDTGNIPEDKLRAVILETMEEDNYYEKEHGKSLQEENEIVHSKQMDWDIRYNHYLEVIRERNINSINHTTELKRRHDAVRADLEKLLTEAKNQTTIDIARFGLEQMKTVASEEKPYIVNPISKQQFINNEKNRILDNIKYYHEKMVEKKKWNEDCIRQFDELMADVNRILPKE